ncbi:hypothetical protein MHPYR_300092 [uncultured Mycobacterium sp.]|uniref:Uncharacterized protein n=1 Tax=uncultured Mycobacterium sp. TaxID=171292 RepID=A0A1Y5PCF1_9MYCO|nr:hypothetical protein MHPYR_300092 [uncultured Mycobacterium sp.]
MLTKPADAPSTRAFQMSQRTTHSRAFQMSQRGPTPVAYSNICAMLNGNPRILPGC